jgi:hypothetical protein
MSSDPNDLGGGGTVGGFLRNVAVGSIVGGIFAGPAGLIEGAIAGGTRSAVSTIAYDAGTSILNTVSTPTQNNQTSNQNQNTNTNRNTNTMRQPISNLSSNTVTNSRSFASYKQAALNTNNPYQMLTQLDKTSMDKNPDTKSKYGYSSQNSNLQMRAELNEMKKQLALQAQQNQKVYQDTASTNNYIVSNEAAWLA